MLKFGKVTEIDEAKALARVEFDDCDGVVSWWLHIRADKSLSDKDYYMFDTGEQVACLVDERLEDGVVLCAVYSETDTPPISNKNKCYRSFNDGGFFEYDKENHKLKIHSKDVELIGDLDMTGDSVIKGDIKITGDVQIIGDVEIVGNLRVTQVISTMAITGLTEDIELPGTTTLQVPGNIHVTGWGQILQDLKVAKILKTSTITANQNNTIQMNGNVNIAGSVIDTGRNTNHHVHYWGGYAIGE